jgi:DNA-binding response OmpR family regulator
MSTGRLARPRTPSGILLVDGEPRIQSFISRALAEAGYATVCASGGADALRLATTKPFALEELLARVRVQLRGDPRHEVLRSGELRLDVGRMQADTGQGPIALTRLEFLLLRELMEHAGHSVPKDQLLASTWGYDFDPGSNVVDVCVRRLRSKLGFELIRTVRGAGHHLAS